MNDIPQMSRPWSVVGAGFNDEGVYFTFEGSVIHRDDINLMQAAPELLKALQAVVRVADRATDEFDMARAAIAKALGNN